MSVRASLCILLVSLVVPSLGCVSLRSARELSAAEMQFIQALHTRAAQNRAPLEASLADLSGISRSAIEDSHSLQTSIAKAKLLESMKSPWARPSSSLVETQRAVALYHLYALAEAEQEVVAAKLRERSASTRKVLTRYDELTTLLVQAAEAQKLILAHLNQSDAAHALEFVSNLLVEVNAFQRRLAQSEDPDLQRFAGEVAEAEAKVQQARQGMQQALGFILKR